MVQQVVNSIRLVVLVGALSLSSAACADPDAALHARLAVAEQKYAEAQRAGFAWRASRTSLERAKAALQENDPQLAEDLIEESILLSQASLAQAEREAQDWSSRFPFGGA